MSGRLGSAIPLVHPLALAHSPGPILHRRIEAERILSADTEPSSPHLFHGGRPILELMDEDSQEPAQVAEHEPPADGPQRGLARSADDRLELSRTQVAAPAAERLDVVLS